MCVCAGQIEVIEYLEELIDLTKLLVGANEFRSGMLTRPSYREYVEKISTRTNSDLALISESEFEEGLGRLFDYCRENPGHPRTEEVDHFLFTADSKRTSR